MKEKWTRKVLRRFAAGVLLAIMILTGACLFDEKAGTVHAEDTESDATTEAIYVNVPNISAYRGENNTYPKPTQEGKEDWIFAGWYKEDTNAENEYTAYKESEMSDVTTAYAKYVSPEVVSVKLKVSARNQ